MTSEFQRQMARNAFDKARKDAALLDLFNRLRGKSTQLFSFEDVHNTLGGIQGRSGIRREIPLDAIVGSVGRYADFNRDFLPLAKHDRERWSGVKVAMETKGSIPPIEVYKVGEVYFVVDGNHRVSIAKNRGDTMIMASITEINTRVGLSPDDSPKDLVCKAEYRRFLDASKLDETIGKIEFEVSEIGHYEVLLQQIEAIRLEKEEAGEEAPDFETAAQEWYQNHYQPVIEVLREQNFLRHYPNRTETDLYIWLVENRKAIEEEFGWTLQVDSVAAELAARQRSRGMLQRTKQIFNPDLDTGDWRERQLAAVRGKMFADIVVLLDKDRVESPALEEALFIAAQEEAHLLGLVIEDVNSKQSPDIDAIESVFEKRCAEAGIFGQITTGKGEIKNILKARTRWADLAVLPAPAAGADPHVYHELLEAINIPVVVAHPSTHSNDRVLLAYDDSPKSQEALFLAAYLSGLWGFALDVISVEEGNDAEGILEDARSFLELYSLEANYMRAQAPAAPAILEAAASSKAVFIIAGSYQAHKFGRHHVGGTLDTLLAESSVPLLICR